MIKAEEVSNPTSCLNRALDDEMLFTLLGRDVAAPSTIRFWVAARIHMGKNTLDDAQIVEALACAKTMESYARRRRGIGGREGEVSMTPEDMESLEEFEL